MRKGERETDTKRNGIENCSHGTEKGIDRGGHALLTLAGGSSSFQRKHRSARERERWEREGKRTALAELEEQEETAAEGGGRDGSLAQRH